MTPEQIVGDILAEKSILSENIEQAKNYLDSNADSPLSGAERAVLQDQYGTMMMYSSQLDARLRLLNAQINRAPEAAHGADTLGGRGPRPASAK